MNRFSTSAALRCCQTRRYSRCSQCFLTVSKMRVSTTGSCRTPHSFFQNVHRMQGSLLGRLPFDGRIRVLCIWPRCAPFFCSRSNSAIVGRNSPPLTAGTVLARRYSLGTRNAMLASELWSVPACWLTKGIQEDEDTNPNQVMNRREC